MPIERFSSILLNAAAGTLLAFPLATHASFSGAETKMKNPPGSGAGG
jgi:hypothetical protein